MKSSTILHFRPGSNRAFTFIELTMATSTFALVSGALLMCFSVMNRSLTMSQQYALGKLTLTDYIAMDLRRSQIDLPKCGGVTNPTTSTSFTFPLVLKQPDCFAADNRSLVNPTYATVVLGTTEKSQQKLTSADYILPYRYNATTKTSLPRYVTYYLNGTSVFRREEAYDRASTPVLTTISDRLIATDVTNVTFSSDEIPVGAAPFQVILSELGYQVSFKKSCLSQATSTTVGGTANQTVLFGRTFMRYATYGPTLPTHP
jgi:hypothetical protein